MVTISKLFKRRSSFLDSIVDDKFLILDTQQRLNLIGKKEAETEKERLIFENAQEKGRLGFAQYICDVLQETSSEFRNLPAPGQLKQAYNSFLEAHQMLSSSVNFFRYLDKSGTGRDDLLEAAHAKAQKTHGLVGVQMGIGNGFFATPLYDACLEKCKAFQLEFSLPGTQFVKLVYNRGVHPSHL